MKTKFYLLILITVFTSCGKSYQCTKTTMSPIYVSYSDSEIDTIILRRFKLGSNYSTRIDSTILTAVNCQYNRVSDTVYIYPADINNYISGDYDWQIFNPFDQKTVSISKIQFQINESTRGGFSLVPMMDPAPACFSPLISYTQDNVVVNSNTGQPLYYFYIHK